MAMNRQQRREQQRAGVIDADGEPVRQKRTAPTPPRPTDQRATAGEFLREVRAELRKVAWPTREETINYTYVVVVALVLVTTMIFGLDWVFNRAVEALYSP